MNEWNADLAKIPKNPKIYHIIHIDRLSSLIKESRLWSDSYVRKKQFQGTTIGLTTIKQRRLQNFLRSHPSLSVGNCVPFYFCPRSIMLYLIHMKNPRLNYHDGQENIIHLQADLYQVINWANALQPPLRWAFTTSNAGSSYFEDYCDINKLDQINWQAVNAKTWKNYKEGKQAEFLLEKNLPWCFIEYIGVYDEIALKKTVQILKNTDHFPKLNINKNWYY